MLRRRSTRCSSWLLKGAKSAFEALSLFGDIQVVLPLSERAKHVLVAAHLAIELC